MITKGVDSESARGSWDTKSLFAESRYKMPALHEAVKGRNYNGTLTYKTIADEKTVQYA